jgi:hypothetical protein
MKRLFLSTLCYLFLPLDDNAFACDLTKDQNAPSFAASVADKAIRSALERLRYENFLGEIDQAKDYKYLLNVIKNYKEHDSLSDELMFKALCHKISINHDIMYIEPIINAIDIAFPQRIPELVPYLFNLVQRILPRHYQAYSLSDHQMITTYLFWAISLPRCDDIIIPHIFEYILNNKTIDDNILNMFIFYFSHVHYDFIKSINPVLMSRFKAFTEEPERGRIFSKIIALIDKDHPLYKKIIKEQFLLALNNRPLSKLMKKVRNCKFQR